MALDTLRMVGLIMKPLHIARIYEQWKESCKDMPFAIAMGAPPITVMAATVPLSEGVTEAEYVGSLWQGPRISELRDQCSMFLRGGNCN
jgi:UbiD family decarboxylase